MAQFTVYLNGNPASKKTYPYLMDVQSALLDSLETRLVIPLALQSRFERTSITRLNPVVRIKTDSCIVLTQQMAAIRTNALGSAVCDCLADRQEILSAIDILITGI